MLTGSDLLAKVKELGDVSKSDLVRACGYVSTKKNGGERLNFTAFYEALLEAKGVNLGDSGVAGIGKGGRKLSYIATVQGNGNLLIGKKVYGLIMIFILGFKHFKYDLRKNLVIINYLLKELI